MAPYLELDNIQHFGLRYHASGYVFLTTVVQQGRVAYKFYPPHNTRVQDEAISTDTHSW